MANKKYYITTAIDYANSEVHIGHSYQKLLADAIARYHRKIGDKTFFLTGTDEHGQKVQKSAEEKGQNPKYFVDKIAEKDKSQWSTLNISYDRFIRTTDKDHINFVKKFYKKVKNKGDIYLDTYEGLYCEGCEAFIEKSDLVGGRCPFHPNKAPQEVKEKNYFFRLSKYEEFLIDHIKKNPDFIIPEKRKNEVVSFIKRGLKDFSISRQGVEWGIPVPDNPEHTIYVWFDALINYLTYGKQKNCWPADVHVLGKDNSRFHAIYWPAMLKSADYELPKTILVHEFISLNGQKISKSLGNVIRPKELVEKYGTDSVRYFFLRYGPLSNDVDISVSRIEEAHQADLANGLGNLVARIAGLAGNTKFKTLKSKQKFSPEVKELIENYNLDKALAFIWNEIRKADVFINKRAIWELKGDQRNAAVLNLVKKVRQIATDLEPFLPETAKKIQRQFEGKEVISAKPLFPRLE